MARSLRVLTLLAFLGAMLAVPQAALSAEGAPEESSLDAPVVRQAAAYAQSPSLRTLAAVDGTARAGPTLPEPGLPFTVPRGGASAGRSDPALQRSLGGGTAPGIVASFNGIAQVTGARRPIPPDTVGDVGPNHYVQMVNATRFAVFAKDGRLLLGPLDLSTVLAPLGDVCGISDEGDPIVLYDQLADRWILTQFGFVDPFAGPYYECIAVSATGDPTGAYHLYSFKISDTALNDYPKFGVWPDAYYMSANEFSQPELFFSGVGVVAFERERMLAGDPNARMVYFSLFRTYPSMFSLLPADLDGSRLPPAGAPNPFVGLGIDFDVFGGFRNELRLFRFHVDWSNPGRSTFTGPARVPVASYDPNLCDFDDCIPQKGTFQKLDALSSRLMNRLAYRNFGSHEALVVNHTVDVGGDRAGIRWYEIRSPFAGPKIHQQGTFAPDDDHRWMGSIAMDGNGNMALGYSVSSADMHPSVRFTGRLADDPPGVMTLGEGTLVEGGGSQTSPFGRWGDYSAMTVDPADDCTFWYTQEYYASTSQRSWRTRIGAFTVPSCDATAPTVKALGSKGTARKKARLRYRSADNKGETREVIDVLRPDGRRVRRVRTAFHPADGSIRSVTTKAPRAPGRYSFCVTSFDRQGNASAESCARLKIRR